MSLDDEIGAELADLASRDRLRATSPLTSPDGVHARRSDGTLVLCFCGNDYLGLAHHPDVSAAATAACEQYGFGAGASRLVSGETPAHRDLERGLAEHLGAEDCLLFPTGYQANMGVLTALAGPEDLIASDEANHASIIDGCRLSRARVAVYPHRDIAKAAAVLAGAGKFRRRLLVTESVFSMDGDRAPLAELAALATLHQAVLVVDEAHAMGVAGPSGRGVAAAAGITPPVVVGTLGKALGSHGGFAAGSGALRAILINRARSFIYTTACPSPVAAAARAALNLVRSPVGQVLRDRAHDNAQRARAGLRALGLHAPGEDLILPLVVGSDARALAAAAALLDRGLLVPAIRPPTVPTGTARLRITISATHTAEDIKRLLDVLAAIQGNLLPPQPPSL